jgi:hypothetical protein
VILSEQPLRASSGIQFESFGAAWINPIYYKTKNELRAEASGDRQAVWRCD